MCSMRVMVAIVVMSWFVQSLNAAPPPAAKPEITATFSIIAVDPENHICGAAVASKYLAVGKVVPYVRADVGAFCTQHHHVPKWGEPALDLLQQGKRPEAVLFELLKEDKDSELRQLAIIDMQGRAAVHNPTEAPAGSRYWGAMTGRFYCCQGNTLTGREVVVAMSRAYEETSGSLADRLLAALIAADCAEAIIVDGSRRECASRRKGSRGIGSRCTSTRATTRSLSSPGNTPS